MLSVGTTNAPSIVGTPKLVTGLLGWAKRAPDLLMKAQMQTALNQAEQLGSSRFLRIEDSAQTDGLDDVRTIPMLVNKGGEAGERNYPKIITCFMNGVEAAQWR